MWVCSPWPSSVPDGHSRGNICEQTIALWVLGLIHLLALGRGQCWWLLWDVEFQVGGGYSSNTRAVFYCSVQCRSWCPLAPDPWGAGWNVPLNVLGAPLHPWPDISQYWAEPPWTIFGTLSISGACPAELGTSYLSSSPLPTCSCRVSGVLMGTSQTHSDFLSSRPALSVLVLLSGRLLVFIF